MDTRIRRYAVTIRHVVAEITIFVQDSGMDRESAIMAAQNAIDKADPDELNSKMRFLNVMEVDRVRFVSAEGEEPAPVPVTPKPNPLSLEAMKAL